jgi:addiction module HigA family antidote
MRKKPTSPGAILREEFLSPLGLTQRVIAEHIGCDVKVINRIVNERSSLSADIAIKLAAAFETTAEFWLNAQKEIDLYEAHRRNRKFPKPIMRRKP